MGYAVFTWTGGELTGLLVAGLVVMLLAGIWITVRVPGDVSIPVPILVPTSGRTRLLLELAITAVAAYGIWTTLSRAAGETLLTVVGLHYAVTWERVRWLIQPPPVPKGTTRGTHQDPVD